MADIGSIIGQYVGGASGLGAIGGALSSFGGAGAASDASGAIQSGINNASALQQQYAGQAISALNTGANNAASLYNQYYPVATSQLTDSSLQAMQALNNAGYLGQSYLQGGGALAAAQTMPNVLSGYNALDALNRSVGLSTPQGGSANLYLQNQNQTQNYNNQQQNALMGYNDQYLQYLQQQKNYNGQVNSLLGQYGAGPSTSAGQGALPNVNYSDPGQVNAALQSAYQSAQQKYQSDIALQQQAVDQYNARGIPFFGGQGNYGGKQGTVTNVGNFNPSMLGDFPVQNTANGYTGAPINVPYIQAPTAPGAFNTPAPIAPTRPSLAPAPTLGGVVTPTDQSAITNWKDNLAKQQVQYQQDMGVYNTKNTDYQNALKQYQDQTNQYNTQLQSYNSQLGAVGGGGGSTTTQMSVPDILQAVAQKYQSQGMSITPSQLERVMADNGVSAQQLAQSMGVNTTTTTNGGTSAPPPGLIAPQAPGAFNMQAPTAPTAPNTVMPQFVQENPTDTNAALQEFFNTPESMMLFGKQQAGQTPLQNFQGTPGYQFQLGQGKAAMNAAASAGGFLNNPNLAYNMNNMAQGLANTDFTNYMNQLGGAFNQYQSVLGSLANSGLSSAGQNATIQANLGQAASNLSQGIGTALGSTNMQTGTGLANLTQNQATNLASNQQQLGAGTANTLSALGSNLGNLSVAGGQAAANGILGSQNANSAAFGSLAGLGKKQSTSSYGI